MSDTGLLQEDVRVLEFLDKDQYAYPIFFRYHIAVCAPDLDVMPGTEQGAAQLSENAAPQLPAPTATSTRQTVASDKQDRKSLTVARR